MKSGAKEKQNQIIYVFQEPYGNLKKGA